jgi:ketosteroid isomerase-like protein
MKRILLIILLLVAASAPALAQAANSANSKAEQEVLKTLDEVLRAMVEHDLAAIDRLYTDHYVFSSINGGSASKSQLIEGFKRMKANGASYVSWTPSEMKVAVYGDAAVTNNRFEIKTRNGKGEVNTLNHRYTCAWVKLKGQWKLAAAQATEIKPPAQPAQK